MTFETVKTRSPEYLLTELVKAMVTNPEEVAVTVSKKGGATILTIDVVSDDIGKIIGKGGCLINSIKTLWNALGCKSHKKLLIEIKD